MTKVYFIRHAQPNLDNHDDFSRELSEKGMADRRLVTEFLSDKKIDAVFSSPYKRAFDTVSDFADKNGLKIQSVDDFREREIGVWLEDFNEFVYKQWSDFDYKLHGGESLKEVQSRNISALNQILNNCNGKNIAVGSHGTAISTIINYYDSSFGYNSFFEIRKLMPWIAELDFKSYECINIQKYNILQKFTQ